MNNIRKKFRDKLNKLMSKATTEILSLNKKERTMFSVIAGLETVVLTAGTAYADDFIEDIAKTTNDYYLKLIAVGAVFFVLAIAIAAIWTGLSPKAEGARTPIAWIKRALIAFFVLCIIGGLISVIMDFTKGYQYKYNQ